jgi:hypothetical protein
MIDSSESLPDDETPEPGAVLVDTLGQVALLTPGGQIAAMFALLRGQLAGWLPDGTRFGDAALAGGLPPPDAADRFGAALRRVVGQPLVRR